MRPNPLLGIILIAGCVAPSAGGSAAGGDLALSLSQTTLDARPVLVVTMTNRSATILCIRAELLRNPYSNSMDLRLRDLHGRAVRLEEPGFLLPPIMDPVHIVPGDSVQGRYFLDGRFKLKGGGKQLPEGMSAKAAFRYDLCDASQSRRAVSAWQRI